MDNSLKDNEMKLDINKITKVPTNQYEAARMLVECEQKLITALHIMDSAIENDTEDFQELHKKRMVKFIKQFEL